MTTAQHIDGASNIMERLTQEDNPLAKVQETRLLIQTTLQDVNDLHQETMQGKVSKNIKLYYTYKYNFSVLIKALLSILSLTNIKVGKAHPKYI